MIHLNSYLYLKYSVTILEHVRVSYKTQTLFVRTNKIVESPSHHFNRLKIDKQIFVLLNKLLTITNRPSVIQHDFVHCYQLLIYRKQQQHNQSGVST